MRGKKRRRKQFKQTRRLPCSCFWCSLVLKSPQNIHSVLNSFGAAGLSIQHPFTCHFVAPPDHHFSLMEDFYKSLHNHCLFFWSVVFPALPYSNSSSFYSVSVQNLILPFPHNIQHPNQRLAHSYSLFLSICTLVESASVQFLRITELQCRYYSHWERTCRGHVSQVLQNFNSLHHNPNMGRRSGGIASLSADAADGEDNFFQLPLNSCSIRNAHTGEKERTKPNSEIVCMWSGWMLRSKLSVVPSKRRYVWLQLWYSSAHWSVFKLGADCKEKAAVCLKEAQELLFKLCEQQSNHSLILIRAHSHMGLLSDHLLVPESLYLSKQTSPRQLTAPSGFLPTAKHTCAIGAKNIEGVQEVWDKGSSSNPQSFCFHLKTWCPQTQHIIGPCWNIQPDSQTSQTLVLLYNLLKWSSNPCLWHGALFSLPVSM